MPLPIGFKHSEETKKKMSEAQRGDKNHMFGKHLTKATKLKISKFNKGKIISPEVRQKMSKNRKGKGIFYGKDNSFYGKHHSIKTRRKWSKTRKGRIALNKGKLWSNNYKTIHIWIKNNFGKANHCINPHCLKKSKTYHYANINGIYSHDIRYYIQLCCSCHSKFDKGSLNYIDLFSQ